MPIEPSDAVRRLRTLERGTTPEAALALFDDLPPLTVGDLLGRWAGRGLPTGHPFDGLLERLGWHGKVMRSSEDVHPLVFQGPQGRLVSITPAWLPMGAALRVAPAVPHGLAAAAFRAVRPVITTTRPQARLRQVEHRGVTSAAMVYDRLPVIDVFRRVDDRTALGVMDVRDDPQPYVFVLERADPPQ
ncbi:DUF4334 domain-containing protein [Cellulomonas xiejunii]|uniref:DUF4334 domain-containing protein n=1 Tax=Cellulomonas xiejunii TaxID=2968083 RepID=A0ABY5KQA0_9CELL|nr:DUF4334 domain-containing protein [Cellulomonas xiejunii]MCC2322640.1 DUF4334 domain-containing protein [Cellulomonas xiejunii]UUI72672.1 DUF4334 domain-containing protein [Cellulomonas xiejunii]